MISKKAKAKANASVAQRFPKGGKDALAGVVTLGNSFRNVNNLEFSSIKKGKR